MLLAATPPAAPATPVASRAQAAADFHQNIEPLLKQYCYDCHANGVSKGNISFDHLGTDQELLANSALWVNVLKNVRAGLMPAEGPKPTAAEIGRLADWIKFGALGLDAANPDPGRVTVRRLNRVEYRNTVRDLLGVDYDTAKEFPPDDSGFGFDNIAEALTLSPMLLEKYVNAARSIVDQAVPTVPRVPVEQVLDSRTLAGGADPAINLSYYANSTASHPVDLTQDGHYHFVLDLTGAEKFVDNVFDYNKCHFVVKLDGEELFARDFNRENNLDFQFEFDRDLKAGAHVLTFETAPLEPAMPQVRALAIRIKDVKLRGPMEPQAWIAPKNYARFFPRLVPTDPVERRAYARELLANFAGLAYRRPVDAPTVDRLVALAEGTYQQPGVTFEAGVAHAMVAVLASPRFLFRDEGFEPPAPGATVQLVDEYALASRLSYFLWSSMPDAELTRLAAAGQLRANLNEQVKRMLADPESSGLVTNFAGQWLEARDIDAIPIDAKAVLAREPAPIAPPVAVPPVAPAAETPAPAAADPEVPIPAPAANQVVAADTPPLPAADTPPPPVAGRRGARGQGQGAGANARGAGGRRGGRGAPQIDLTPDLRVAMRKETEMYFDHIMREDRPLVEFLDSDYTFLNQKLAQHYGIPNVTGDDLQLVKLPADSLRGGILTQGTVLVATSNPTRTSPVKRGLFILDNVLGLPVPPPPPNVPALDVATQSVADHEPLLRESLALHRTQPVCASCHNRMDPIGLAMENFNALGLFRTTEHGQPIEVAGDLITGEHFDNVRELKHILATTHREDFYRCLTEKMLTYALGRGLEPSDIATVDNIVARIEREDGRFSALLYGIIESAPFQKRRNDTVETVVKPAKVALDAPAGSPRP